MPRITVELTKGEDGSFGDMVVEACARQMLQRYVYDEDGEQASRPTELARRIEKAVTDEIRAQSKLAAPDIVAKIMRDKVVQHDDYGHAVGSVKSVAEVIADQVKRDVSHGSGRRGDGALDMLIRDEVSRQFRTELKGALDAAKAVIVNALTAEATEALRTTVARGLPTVAL